MKIARRTSWIIGGLTLAVGALGAFGDDVEYTQPLVQVDFDHLVPTSYPIIHPGFHRLQATTEPLIDPGVAKVHITEHLTQAFDQPLLITNDNSYPLVGGTVYQPVVIAPVHLALPVLVTASAARPRLVIPARASTPQKAVDRQQR